MKNNKGFAISIMLYAMVLLIVTIFYIILAIVKNRYNTNKDIVEKGVSFMKENDSYASSGDKTKPIIVFSHNSSVFKKGSAKIPVTVYIFDDDSGGITKDKIKFYNGNSVINNVTCNSLSPIKGFKCTLEFNTDRKLTVEATDKNNNKTVEVRNYSFPSGGPQCEDAKVYKTDGEGKKILDEQLDKNDDFTYKLATGGYAAFVFTCKSSNGIDSKLLASDVSSVMGDATNKILGNFRILDPEIDYNESNEKIVKFKIIVRALDTGTSTISLNKAITDSAGNPSNVISFPIIHSEITGS